MNDSDYETYGEYLDAARERAEHRAGELTDARMLAMFCVALRRRVLDEVGPIDEQFGLGLFEDDDYSERLRRAGYRLGCAQDVLVHHFGEASFGYLFADGRREELLRSNRGRFEQKWGTQWNGHDRQRSDPYRALVERVRRRAHRELPPGARVLVVSRGDEELLELGDCSGAHFPQADGGVYAGHYPADSHEAVDQLERARGEGASHLLFPQTSFWWLDHYGGLAAHLRERYVEVAHDEDCVIFSLNGGGE